MYEQLATCLRQKINPDDAAMATILSYFKPLKAAKEELLLTHGQTSQRTFFVGKGCLRIYFINEQGQDATRHIAFENEFATALCSFITASPSLEFIQAVETSELLYINHRDFYHLLDTVPQWEQFYRDYLEFAYVNNTNRLMSFVTLNALERYRLLLEQNPAIVRRLPNKIVASFLNMSQETLSRLKSRL